MEIERFNVLSLFDGGSMAYPALIKAGVPAKAIKYYASEIDEDAMKVGAAHVPNIVRVGDVRMVNGYNFPNLDLLIAGSPCTSLSIAKRQKESGLYTGESMLFWEFVRIKKESNPKYWILENVASMKKADRDEISKVLGEKHLYIDSALVSGQMRKRYYWTNIPHVTVPKMKDVSLSSVLEGGSTNRDKSYCITATYNRACVQDYFNHAQRQMVCIHEKPMFPLRTQPINAKHPISEHYRKLTPLECERLQTLPEGWTDVGLSDAARYQIIGNGFTVDVISHLLSYIPEILIHQLQKSWPKQST